MCSRADLDHLERCLPWLLIPYPSACTYWAIAVPPTCVVSYCSPGCTIFTAACWVRCSRDQTTSRVTGGVSFRDACSGFLLKVGSISASYFSYIFCRKWDKAIERSNFTGMLMEGLEKCISSNILATSSKVANNQTEGKGYTRVTKEGPSWKTSSFSDIQKSLILVFCRN